MSPRAIAFSAFLFLATSIFALGWFVLDGSTMPPRVIRSRLTVIVNTPEGERTGSSVTQVKSSFPGGLTKAQGWSLWTEFVGEAVVVDLGQRGLLFVTLVKPDWFKSAGWGGSGGYAANMMPFPQEKFRGAYPAQASSTEQYAAYLDELNRVKPKSELAIKDLPVLVRFVDPNVQTSAAILDPNDLAASFGTGVNLKKATVEITDDPITRGVELQLRWLKSSKYTERLIPNPTHQPPPDENPARKPTYDAFRMSPR